MRKTTNSFTLTLTYLEAFLIATQTISTGAAAFVLYQQHLVLMKQNSIITNLSSDLKKLNNELLEIKLTHSQNMMQLSTDLIDVASTPHVPSFIGTKLILGLIGSGVVYFYLMPALAANFTFTLPSLKSVLIPIKSTIVGLIPFLKEIDVLEFLKDGCTYKMSLDGDKVLSLDARPADAVDFKPISEVIKVYNNPVSSPVEKIVDPSTSCDASASSSIDAVDSKSVSEIITQSDNLLSSTVEKIADVATSCDVAVATEYSEYSERALDLLSTMN